MAWEKATPSHLGVGIITISALRVGEERVEVDWVSNGLDYDEVEGLLEDTLDDVRAQRDHCEKQQADDDAWGEQ